MAARKGGTCMIMNKFQCEALKLGSAAAPRLVFKFRR